MVLSSEEVDQFIEEGYVKIPEVFSVNLAVRIVGIVWKELKVDPKDSSTWRGPRLTLERVLEQPPVPEMISERYVQAVDDLCGAGRWSATRGAGYFPILFPGFSEPPWRPPENRWHIDGDPFRRIDSCELGLIGLELFSDISTGGGGTAVRVGSHSYVTRHLAGRDKKEQNVRELLATLNSETKHLPVLELTGKTGDVFLMHPFTLHAESSNCSDQIRIIAVKLVRMNEALNIDQAREAFQSPVETAISKSLVY